MPHYLRLWLACVRYSLVRTMMFRFDFLLWSAVEFAWMAVNLLLIQVIYGHTDSIAGWNKHEMLLLLGTALLIQRLLMGFFWTNLFELGRNVRSGSFDFYLTQPGQPLFMVATRKLDPDGLANAFIALGVVAYAAHALHLPLTVGGIALYIALVAIGLVVHFSLLLLMASLTFWIVKTEGIEGSYFTVAEFGRLPRSAFTSLFTNVVFVYALPAVIVTNVPASALLGRLEWPQVAWLAVLALGWCGLAFAAFHAGIRRYTSASS
ncbi:MAG TPA: ABC-2 family transporter protein [Opitutaceae bacterium]|nr:ABC-2 family transporter protein [Opitutaceae bacterium]